MRSGLRLLLGIITAIVLGWFVLCNFFYSLLASDRNVKRQLQELMLLKGVGDCVVLHSVRIRDQTLDIYRRDDNQMYDMDRFVQAYPIRNYFVRTGDKPDKELVVWLCYAYEEMGMNEPSPIEFTPNSSLPFVFIFNNSPKHKGKLLDVICATSAAPLRINRVIPHHEYPRNRDGGYTQSRGFIAQDMYLSEQEDSRAVLFVDKWPDYTEGTWPSPARYHIQKTHLGIRTIDRGLRLTIGVEGSGLPPEL